VLDLPPSVTLFISSKSMSPKFCEGTDVEKVGWEIEALLEKGWRLNTDEDKLWKTYEMQTYGLVGVRQNAWTTHS
jgi:hypothetical protein